MPRGWAGCAGAELSSAPAHPSLPCHRASSQIGPAGTGEDQPTLNDPACPVQALDLLPGGGIAHARDVPPCQTLLVGKVWMRGWAQLLFPFQGKTPAKDDHGRPTVATKCQLRMPNASQVISEETALVPAGRQESHMLRPVPCWDNHEGRTPSKRCSLPDQYTPFV